MAPVPETFEFFFENFRDGVRRMTLAEVGAYVLLLCEQFEVELGAHPYTLDTPWIHKLLPELVGLSGIRFSSEAAEARRLLDTMARPPPSRSRPAMSMRVTNCGADGSTMSTTARPSSSRT